jgi:hypothetical protein
VIPPGKSATFSVTITRTNARLGSYTFGAITWVEKKGNTSPHAHAVRSNIAVRPVAIAAPKEVAGSGGTSAAITVTPGYTGTLHATPVGLAQDVDTVKHLVGQNQDFNPAAPAEGPAVMKATVAVPDGTRLARFATFDADYPAGTDVDVFVYRNGAFFAQSAGGTAEESVTINNPVAATYDIYVVQFTLAPGRTEQDVHAHSFVVPSSGVPMTVTPATQSVTATVPATVTAGWSGLTPGTRYLGVVDFDSGADTIGSTIVAVTG